MGSTDFSQRAGSGGVLRFVLWGEFFWKTSSKGLSEGGAEQQEREN